MTKRRTERCSKTGVEVTLCECVVHRNPAHFTSKKYVKVPRAKMPRRCSGPCGIAKSSVRPRDLPGVKYPVHLCDDCAEDRRLYDEARMTPTANGAVDWSAVNAALRRSG